jgi:hypothetical protein
MGPDREGTKAQAGALILARAAMAVAKTVQL